MRAGVGSSGVVVSCLGGDGGRTAQQNGSSTPTLCHTIVLSSSSTISRPRVDSTNPT